MQRADGKGRDAGKARSESPGVARSQPKQNEQPATTAIAATASQAQRITQQPGRNDERRGRRETGEHAHGAGPALLPERPEDEKRRDEEQLTFEHSAEGEEAAAPEPPFRQGGEGGEKIEGQNPDIPLRPGMGVENHRRLEPGGGGGEETRRPRRAPPTGKPMQEAANRSPPAARRIPSLTRRKIPTAVSSSQNRFTRRSGSTYSGVPPPRPDISPAPPSPRST